MASKDKAKRLLRSFLASVVHHSGLTHLFKKDEEMSYRILMYHRVIRPEDSQYPLQPGMFVTPETFAMQMKLLAEEANVIPLDRLAEAVVSEPAFPPRTVALTFDDAWADVYVNAFPVLKEYKLPATFFLPTSFIGTSEWFWADKLALAVSALRKEKQYIQTVCTRLKDCGEITEQMCPRITEALTTVEDSQLQDALDAIVEELKRVPYKERLCIVNTTMKLAKEFTTVKLERAFLNWDEVNEMAEHGMTFGSHSHLHQNFAELSPPQMSDEIENSYQQLRAKDLSPSPVFCYPGGRYTEASQKALADKNIRFALTTEKVSHLDTEPYLLGRIGIHDDVSSTPALFTSRVWMENIF